MDGATLGFADHAGNRQYVTTGNLSENGRAFLLPMDDAQRRGVKQWGRTRLAEADAALVARLMPADHPARPEQAILFQMGA